MAPSSFSTLLVFLSILVLAMERIASLPLQQKLDKIHQLPGQPSVNFDQYSGYVTVNETAGRALFYWLVEASVAAQHAPLILWVNSDLSCSTIAYGAIEELGPFRIHPNGKTLYLNRYSWNIEANILFLESIAGVGFSYSNSSSDLHVFRDKEIVLDSYNFLINWFERFPQYKYREFYIIGEGYAGHYIPQLSQIIYRKNKGIENPFINLKGFMVGNARIDDYNFFIGASEYWWSHGLISDNSYDGLKVACKKQSLLSQFNKCLDIRSNALSEMGNIDPYSIYSPTCNDYTSSLKRKHNLKSSFPSVYQGYDPCTKNYATVYYNLPEVQKAFHVNITRLKHEWEICSYFLKGWRWDDTPKSMLPIFKELIAAGLKIWVFSGDTDAIVPVTATRYSLNDLNLTTLINMYPWYDQGKVGGWSQVYNGLTFVIIHGSGHEVPLFRPRQALILFKHFLKNKSMPFE